MSDAAAQIVAAIDPLLRADAGVKAAFGSAKLRLYNMAPEASSQSLFPYIVLGLGHQTDAPYERIDAGDYEATIHVWSRPDPRSMTEAAAIASAVKKALSGLDAYALELPGFGLVQSLPLDTHYLEDPDGLTVHAVVRVQFSYDPA